MSRPHMLHQIEHPLCAKPAFGAAELLHLPVVLHDVILQLRLPHGSEALYIVVCPTNAK